MNTSKISSVRAIYILFLVSLLSAFNYYDRNLLSILVEPLKRELGFTDGQIGLLSGLGFAAVYTLFAIPIARYADNGRRAKVLGVSGILWSIMTGLCGMATGFGTMLAGRLGVGIGEAGGASTTHAIVAESFTPRRRASALSVIGLAGGIGVFAALAGGGHIAQAYGWRVAFYAGALPGLIVAALFLLTVRDPGGSDRAAVAAGVPLREALAVLLRRRAFVWMCLGMSLAGIGAYGAVAWMPAFLMRRFDLTTAQVGSGYSAVLGVATLVGILLGGMLGDFLSKRDARAPFFILAASFGITGPLTLYLLTAGSFAVALKLVFPMTLVATIWISPAYAAVQALSGSRLRATGAATFMLVQNLVGQGLGPSIVGWLSDWFTPTHGKDSLRLALMVVVGTYVIGALCFLMASRTARTDIASADAN